MGARVSDQGPHQCGAYTVSLPVILYNNREFTPVINSANVARDTDKSLDASIVHDSHERHATVVIDVNEFLNPFSRWNASQAHGARVPTLHTKRLDKPTLAIGVVGMHRANEVIGAAASAFPPCPRANSSPMAFCLLNGLRHCTKMCGGHACELCPRSKRNRLRVNRARFNAGRQRPDRLIVPSLRTRVKIWLKADDHTATIRGPQALPLGGACGPA